MLKKTKHSDSKILVQLINKTNEDIRFIYEPVARKLGGVWNKQLCGWIFDSTMDNSINEFLISQLETEIDENPQDYSLYTRDPSTYNTPTSESTENDDTYGLIQELFDRVSDLEKVTDELCRRLKH